MIAARRSQLAPITDHNVLVWRVAQLGAQARQQAMAVREHKSDAERGNHNERTNDAGGNSAALRAAVRLVGLGQDAEGGGGGGGGQNERACHARSVRLLLKLGEAFAEACVFSSQVFKIYFHGSIHHAQFFLLYFVLHCYAFIQISFTSDNKNMYNPVKWYLF